MRIALVVHGFPPHERTGVETHTAALAGALARRGIETHVFAPRRDPRTPELALRRETRGGASVTWITTNCVPRTPEERLDPPGVARAFGEFLDRERPSVVHFQHFHKLGVGCLEAALERGLATVYTAHDFAPVCHRAILAHPDLARCETPGEARACARCDAAAGFLDGLGRFSDWHGGVLSEQLSTEERRELARALDPAREDAAAVAVRTALDRRRRAAFGALDLVLAPTAFLRARLAAGGLDGAKIELSPCGIEQAALAALPPPRAKDGRPVAFGYVGGAEKHKGVHVLLDAFSRLRAPAQLALHADSTDREYVRLLRARARELGVHWRGAFEAQELPQRLAELDVLVVPSIWWENAPFVILEAQAAGRPVVASDLPALAELVRDGQDGLLASPGDAGALHAALERLASEPALLAELASNARAPRSLDDQCDELIARYRELAAARAPRLPASLPESARPFAARVLEQQRLSTAELAARALARLPELATALGVDPRLARPAAPGEAALERLRDARRELAWRAEQGAHGALLLERERAARRALALELERAREDGERARDALLAAGKELAARTGELERAAAAHAAAQSAWQSEQRAHGEAQAALAAAKRALDALAEEARWLEALRAELAAGGAELARRLESAGAELEAERARAAELAGALGALQDHARWLERESAGLTRRFGDRAEALTSTADFDAARAHVERFERELAWRREEMRGARKEGGRILRALLDRSGLGRRMRGWEGGP